MAEVLSPPAITTSPSPSPHGAPRADSPSASAALSRPREPRPQQRERIPSYAQSRMSTYSQRTSLSRPHSNIFPAFQSSLSYALVRDFAYPVFHPMHYGASPDPPSGATTPGSEQWNGARRQSDPTVDGNPTGGWSAGPWGGDGVMYGEPGPDGVEPLPSTSFGDEDGEDEAGFRQSAARQKQHRKSKSYDNLSDYERGRRRESARSRAGNDDMFHFTGQQTDPAGRDSLRQSRGYGYNASTSAEHGNGRRDSHFATTLPSRSFQSAQQPVDPDTDMPLDAEIPTSPSHSPQRQSICPEDEELFAGRSLALYDFEPENPNELRLREMQEIMVSYRHGQGWLVAEDPETGEQGLVPEAYVRLLADLPHYDPETGTFNLEEGAEGEEGEEGGAPEPEVGDRAEMNVQDVLTDGLGKDDRVDEAYEEAEAEDEADDDDDDDDDELDSPAKDLEAQGPPR